jgi:hypothetical protein
MNVKPIRTGGDVALTSTCLVATSMLKSQLKNESQP